METQFIKLNMTPTGVNPCFHVSQYDIGRSLGFMIYNGSEVVDLDSYTCTIEATRSDGVAITASVATDDNIGTFETTATMTNKADKYKAQFVIVDGDSNRIASLPFDMDVCKAAMDENSESIEEDASLYQQYTEAVQATFAEVKSDIQAEEDARADADNALQMNIDKLSVFVTPEMYGAKGDGITDDTNAFISAINSRLPIKADNNKTYKISTINIPKSFVLIGGKYYSDSSDTLKEIFLINAGNIHVKIYDIEFTSVMDKPAVTFTDEVLSSNVLFIHNNGYATSDYEIYNSKISNCEYCLKSEEGGFRAINCDLVNSMMPVFSNTTNIDIEDCNIDSIATNGLYHCIYLLPHAIGNNGYVINCSFTSKVTTALQCYNDINTFNDELNNLFIENCTFKNSLDGNLTNAFGYNNCKPRFENCKLATAYSGYYNNCICELAGLYENTEITNSICALNEAFRLTGSLSIADSVIEINGNVAYMINVNGGTLKLLNNIIKTTNTNNIIRLKQATVDLYKNIIERATGTTRSIADISDADSVFTALDNVCNVADTLLGSSMNTWLEHPDKFLPIGWTGASAVANSDVGFFEFHTNKQGYKVNITLQTREAQWTSGSTICTLKSSFIPVTRQYVVLYDSGIKEAIVCRLDTDGTLKVYHTTNIGTSGYIEGQFSFYTKRDMY